MGKFYSIFVVLLAAASFSYARESALAPGYMHKSRDNGDRVTFIDAKATQSEILANAPAMLSDETFQIPGGRVADAMPVIVLNGGETLQLPVSLMSRDQLRNAAGHTVRFHIWIKAEKVGEGMNLWEGAPRVTFRLKDDSDNIVAEIPSGFKTCGTYPWFCYYIDLPIPANLSLEDPKAPGAVTASEDGMESDDFDFEAGFEEEEPSTVGGLPFGAGVFVKVTNPASGKAYFSGLSWEILIGGKKVSVDSKYGSRAPNPDYDDLAMHLFAGVGKPTTTHWGFLEGNKAYDSLLTIDGLEAYLAAANGDWFRMIYGVSYLNELKNGVDDARRQIDAQIAKSKSTEAPKKSKSGKAAAAPQPELNLELPPVVFEDGWSETLANFLVESQDKTTGLWMADGNPDIMVSWAIVSRLFSPISYVRADSPTYITPHHSVNGMSLPKAEEVIETLLGSSIKKGPYCFWNQYCLAADNAIGLEDRNVRCQLGTTAAAVSLLRVAADSLDDENPLKELAYQAIDAAVDYVIDNMVTDDGSFLQNSDDFTATSPAFIVELIEASKVLENRTNENLLPADITGSAVEKGTKLKVTVNGFYSQQHAIRIYSIDSSREVASITNADLVAVIQRRDNGVGSQDPVLVVRKMLETAGVKWASFMETKRHNALYTFAKLNQLPLQSKIDVQAFRNGEMTINLPVSAPAKKASDDEEEEDYEEEEDASVAYYAVAIDRHGRASTPVKIKPVNAASEEEDEEEYEEEE